MSLFKFIVYRAFREMIIVKQRSLLVILCIAIGISAISSVQFYTTSVENHLQQNIKAISGGDIVITLRRDIIAEQNEFLEQGRAAGRFDYTMIRETQGVLLNPKDLSKSMMVSIKLVEPEKYPFYGDLAIEGGAHPLAGRDILLEDQILVDESTFRTLGLDLGDQVRLGSETFVVGGQITEIAKMDMMNNPLFGHVIMPTQERRGVFTDQYLLKLTDTIKLDEIASEIREVFPPITIGTGNNTYDPVRTYQENATQVSEMSQQLSNFLLVAGLVSLVLGGLGIFSSVSMMVKQKMKDVAVLKCFGGKPWQILFMFQFQVLFLTLIGIVTGLLAGMALFNGIVMILGELITFKPDLTVDWTVIGRTSLLGILISTLFSLLPILGSLKIKPLLLYRQELMEKIAGRNFFLSSEPGMLTAPMG